jgi:hypothetical protein
MSKSVNNSALYVIYEQYERVTQRRWTTWEIGPFGHFTGTSAQLIHVALSL